MQNSVQIHPDLSSISDPFSHLILDAYGVFWGGNLTGVMPGSKDAMDKMVRSGKIVAILSNTTQLAENEIAKLGKHGLIQGKHFHFLITSGEVAKQTFSTGHLQFPTPRKTFWVLGTPHPKFSSHEVVTQGSPFKEVKDLMKADFILISIPHIHGEDQTDPVAFKCLIDQIKGSNLPLVCTNPDRFAHEGNPPRPVVRQGSIAAMYEETGGKVYYFGKPSRLVFDVAMDRFSQENTPEKSAILMVGDTPETDIKGASDFGIKSALVMTGIMADRISHHGRQKALEAISSKPDFYIERLGAL